MWPEYTSTLLLFGHRCYIKILLLITFSDDFIKFYHMADLTTKQTTPDLVITYKQPKEDKPPLKIVLKSEKAKIPSRSTPFSAGYDLFSAQAVVVPPNGGQAMVSLDLAIQIPPGLYMCSLLVISRILWENSSQIWFSV